MLEADPDAIDVDGVEGLMPRSVVRVGHSNDPHDP